MSNNETIERILLDKTEEECNTLATLISNAMNDGGAYNGANYLYGSKEYELGGQLFTTGISAKRDANNENLIMVRYWHEDWRGRTTQFLVAVEGARLRTPELKVCTGGFAVMNLHLNVVTVLRTAIAGGTWTGVGAVVTDLP